MDSANMGTIDGGWALVTGACSGIGLELSRELARRGHPLVMVSNRETELAAAAEKLAAEHQVQIQTIPFDLAQPDAAAALYEEVKRRGVEVDILVSNAGVFFFGDAVDADPKRAKDMLHLHVVTPSLLARWFARDMRARRRGHVLFVSSICAWRDFPGIAWYGSSKRYLRSFAASLREELAPWGVKVTCLAPGAVATDLYDRSKVPVDTAAKYRVMTDPSRVAKMGVEGMLRGKAVVIPGLSAKLMTFVMATMPHAVIRLIRRRGPFLSHPPD
jgi:short-subunit dehydrogenase